MFFSDLFCQALMFDPVGTLDEILGTPALACA
jgi:hypothetical protein